MLVKKAYSIHWEFEIIRSRLNSSEYRLIASLFDQSDTVSIHEFDQKRLNSLERKCFLDQKICIDKIHFDNELSRYLGRFGNSIYQLFYYLYGNQERFLPDNFPMETYNSVIDFMDEYNSPQFPLLKVGKYLLETEFRRRKCYTRNDSPLPLENKLSPDCPDTVSDQSHELISKSSTDVSSLVSGQSHELISKSSTDVSSLVSDQSHNLISKSSTDVSETMSQ